MLIINTPHNPVGKVFNRHELEAIAALAEEFNIMVMSDEVVCTKLCERRTNRFDVHNQYDCLVFDGKEHIRFATLPGMWDRTVTVYSAGSEYGHYAVSGRNLNSIGMSLQKRSLRQGGESAGS